MIDYTIHKEQQVLPEISDVILSTSIKKQIDDFLLVQKSIDDLRAAKLHVQNKLLFYGDPGTGKTYLASALAKQLNRDLYILDIAAISGKEDAPAIISQVFKELSTLDKYLLFIDECDAIARDRSDNSVAEVGYMRRVINSLFTQLDNVGYNGVIVAATNLLSSLDPAFVRRFTPIEFKRPKSDLNSIIRKFIPEGYELSINETEDIISKVQKVVFDVANFPYSVIREAVESAVFISIQNQLKTVALSAIYKELMTRASIDILVDNDGLYYLHKRGADE